MKLLLTTVLSILLLSCNNWSGLQEPERNIEASIQTEALAYELQHRDDRLEAEIPHMFSNPRQDTVYIVNCNGHFALKLQKQEDDTWIDAYSPVVPQCLSAPVEIAPQTGYPYTLNIVAAIPSSDARPQFQVEEIEGTYRLVWIDVLASYNPDRYPFGEQIPLDQRVSNKFVLQVGDD